PRRGDRLEAAQRQRANLFGNATVERCRDDQPRAFVQVFRVVVVELVRRDDFPDDRGLRLIVAEHADLELTRIDGPLDQQLAIEARREAQARDQLGAIVGLRGADARARVRELREARIAQALLDQGDEGGRGALVLPPGYGERVDDRQAGGGEGAFHMDLVEPEGRAEHTGADVR